MRVSCVEFVNWAHSAVVARPLCKRKAPGSIPGVSKFPFLAAGDTQVAYIFDAPSGRYKKRFSLRYAFLASGRPRRRHSARFLAVAVSLLRSARRESNPEARAAPYIASGDLDAVFIALA